MNVFGPNRAFRRWLKRRLRKGAAFLIQPYDGPLPKEWYWKHHPVTVTVSNVTVTIPAPR